MDKVWATTVRTVVGGAGRIRLDVVEQAGDGVWSPAIGPLGELEEVVDDNGNGIPDVCE